MRHRLITIADNSRLDAVKFIDFALANERRYGIERDPVLAWSTTSTLFVDDLVAAYRAAEARAIIP